MKISRKFLTLALSALLILGLAACGGEGDSENPQPIDTQPIDTQSIDTQPSDREPVTDMASLDGMWSIKGITMLYFNSEEGYYAFREDYTGRCGQGPFWEENGKAMIKFNGFDYDLAMRDDGVLLPHQNGESDDFHISGYTFRPDEEAEFLMFADAHWDGMWQNAVGETILIDSARGQYIAVSPTSFSGGTARNENDGMGFYLYDEGRVYICPGADGNSFRLLGGSDMDRFSEDGHWDGVFYRDGDFESYTDLSQAEFTNDGFIWYFDGVNTFGLNDFYYEIGDDGLAHYIADGQVFPAGWIPEEPYDPADDWGEDWMDNWD